MRWVLVAVLCLALAAPAEADGVPEIWKQRAVELAVYIWRSPSAPELIAAPRVPGTDYASWYDRNFPGTIFYDQHFRWLGYPEFCMMVLHEEGHRRGLGHSSYGLMRPVLSVSVVDTVDLRGRPRRRWEGVAHRCLWSPIWRPPDNQR